MCSEGEPHQGNSNNYQYSQRSPNHLLVSTAVSQPLIGTHSGLPTAPAVPQPLIVIYRGLPTAHWYPQRSPNRSSLSTAVSQTANRYYSTLCTPSATCTGTIATAQVFKRFAPQLRRCRGPSTMLRSALVARSVLRIRRLIDRTARSGAPMRRRLGSQWPSTCQAAATTTRTTGRCTR